MCRVFFFVSFFTLCAVICAHLPIPGRSITTPFGKKGSWAAGYHTGDDYAWNWQMSADH
ncbi:unnamed protein product, partial [Adineta ricciae]